ncbi:DUF3748 domain-containing protein [Novipirellula artificiosorum]|uniref:WD40-like Beta Propeller Repeat protein n=1 Tax=Novipirellula artificiosorum TaxID=2528016 RepID=A0A5C6E079_9BACT|nr:DUF3748 domain-containing protein [Novipirellula artificiosorum]TWU42125.1 WD40-like Beta Propeller Repeat protein [Novipirellula artificiosorum]
MTNPRQLTSGSTNHLLTNAAVWSHDGRWIYYDVRSDRSGAQFDGNRIERVCVESGETELVFAANRGANVGVVTANPVRDEIVFIHGPENPTPDWQYAACHRRGVLVQPSTKAAKNLDARDLVAPFTPGALRGGTHLHVFSGDGACVSFTYEDHVLAHAEHRKLSQLNQRNVGVSLPTRSVSVPKSHPRNHDGAMFSVLVTRTTDTPTSGSDEISRAYSDAWIGTHGYLRKEGSRQSRALAFIGDTVDASGAKLSELFVVDVANDVGLSDDELVCGTPTTRPAPPRGTTQRRLTYTGNRRYPGLGDVRHWPRSSPDGCKIAFLMKDDLGKNQLWLVDPCGESLCQLTDGDQPVQSAFTFRNDGRAIACVIGDRVCEVDVESGGVVPLTREPTKPTDSPPRGEAVVYSPDGRDIAFVRAIETADGIRNHIFLVSTQRNP